MSQLIQEFRNFTQQDHAYLTAKQQAFQQGRTNHFIYLEIDDILNQNARIEEITEICNQNPCEEWINALAEKEQLKQDRRETANAYFRATSD
tara:strand:- start:263 stop:538 length:276 start_codon:yes stop_codon:yes gene_type:complete